MSKLPCFFTIFFLGGVSPNLIDAQPTGATPKSIVPAETNQPPWWEAAASGNRLWEEGEEEGAIARWQEAVDKGFRDGMVFYHLGMYYHEQKDWEKAARYLRLVKPWVESRKEDPVLKSNLYLALGGAYLGLKRYGEAFIHYQKLLRLNPDSSEAHLGLSQLYLSQGKLKSAKTAAQKVLSMQPDKAGAYSVLARVATEEKDYQAAVRFYRRLLAIEPSWWEKRLVLAWLLHYQLGKEEDAERELKEVIASAPASAVAHAALSGIYLRQGKETLAREEAERTLALEPENYEGLIVMGQIFLRENDWERAGNYFQKALRADPQGTYAHYGIGVVALQKDDRAEAESRFRQALQNNPRFPEAAYNLGVVLETTGRREEAKKEFRNILEDSPDFVPAHLGLGKLYYLQGDLKKAVSFFKNVMALDKKSWEAPYFLAKCFYDGGRLEDALEYSLMAKRLKPSHPALLSDLGLVYDKLGQPELARKSFEDALSLDPHYLPALLNLAIHQSRQEHFGEAAAIYEQAVIIKPGEIKWGYAGESTNFLEKTISSLADYLSSGVDYLSLYRIIENTMRPETGFGDLILLLQEKIKENPFEPHYLHLLGMVYQKLGQMDGAEEAYLRALQVDSDTVAAHLSLGQLYTQQGRLVLARPHLEAFLALSPDSSLAPVVAKLLEKVREVEGGPRDD